MQVKQIEKGKRLIELMLGDLADPELENLSLTPSKNQSFNIS